MKRIVIFFSATGTTKKVAEKLAKMLASDLFEIIPEESYKEVDLDWENENSRSSIEMNDERCRPKIKNRLENLEEYNIIYLGFPIWWYQAPRIVETFLESYDFKDKTIITFATSGGSSFGNTTKILQQIAPNANFIDGRILNLDSIEEFLAERESL